MVASITTEFVLFYQRHMIRWPCWQKWQQFKRCKFEKSEMNTVISCEFTLNVNATGTHYNQSWCQSRSMAAYCTTIHGNLGTCSYRLSLGITGEYYKIKATANRKRFVLFQSPRERGSAIINLIYMI